MGIFGGSGDTGSSDYGSKLRTPSYSTELDLSSDPSGNAGLGRSTLDMAGGDLEAGLQIEQGKAQLMSQVHNLTEVCWDTCIKSVSSKMSGRDENCLNNCAARFVDTAMFFTNRYAQILQKQVQH